MNYNRVLKLADYEDFGITRKQWEVAMALLTLRDFGAVHDDAEILGVGAGRERTIYVLSGQVRRVFATDLYLDAGSWSGWHGPDFLRTPWAFAPEDVAFDDRRIVAQHADMRRLPYPDDTFDGIFSSGSIEHVGVEGTFDSQAIEKAASEIGRVLKPGGVASLSTEWKIAGDGWGWSHVRLFDEGLLMRHIVEPSGLDMVDELDTETDFDLNDYTVLEDVVMRGYEPEVEALMKEHQFLYTSVHLALRKPA